MASIEEIRERADKAHKQTKDVDFDRQYGWHPAVEDFDDFVLKERSKAKKVWNAMPARPTTDDREWIWLMWMWARRVRRDILVLEEYLKAEKAAGNLGGPIPFYDDPGDPPPPPDGFI
jgi:hypothetical protein